MMQTFVGITMAFEGDTHRLRHAYVGAVERAGAIPVLVPSLEREGFASELAERLDALVIPGGPAIVEGLIGELPDDLARNRSAPRGFRPQDRSARSSSAKSPSSAFAMGCSFSTPSTAARSTRTSKGNLTAPSPTARNGAGRTTRSRFARRLTCTRSSALEPPRSTPVTSKPSRPSAHRFESRRRRRTESSRRSRPMTANGSAFSSIRSGWQLISVFESLFACAPMPRG